MTSSDSDSSSPALEFTGERFTPECVREIFYEHWHRYAWARGLVAGLDVLDCACGEGYGSRLLADTARSVHGVDVDDASIEHARGRYAGSGVEFTTADALHLPFDDDRFDAVVSFETLEHLSEHEQLLSEFRRVLRPGGFLVISSPDRKTYSDDTGFDNEFHVRELYRDELEALLGRHFPNFRLFGQKLVFQSALWSLDDRSHNDRSRNDRSHNDRAGPLAEHLSADDDGNVERTDRPQPAPLYFLALAAAHGVDLPSTPALSLFDDRAESVYAHYNEEVRKHIRAGHLLAERDAEIAALKESRMPLGARLKRWLKLRR